MIDGLLSKNLLPDLAIRAGIRHFLRKKIAFEGRQSAATQKNRLESFVDTLCDSPIAAHTADANSQHYEVPTEFFKLVLGKHLKYSCGYWRPSAMRSGGPYGRPDLSPLDLSEVDMLNLSIERAEIRDGMTVLDLGCGWGSLSLYLAAQFPACRITALSNSSTQKRYIDAEASRQGLTNIKVLTANVAEFQSDQTFDRVVSIEMLEHMRNYEKLFEKIAGFMHKDSKFFAHIFCHKTFAYAYEIGDPNDWIAKYFFTGGIMPSSDLFSHFQKHLKIQYRWIVEGTHYQKTCRAWLKNMDRHRAEIFPLFEKTYGKAEALKWWVYWRVFFMSCEELFGFRKGSEWFVSHYLFKKA